MPSSMTRGFRTSLIAFSRRSLHAYRFLSTPTALLCFACGAKTAHTRLLQRARLCVCFVLLCFFIIFVYLSWHANISLVATGEPSSSYSDQHCINTPELLDQQRNRRKETVCCGSVAYHRTKPSSLSHWKFHRNPPDTQVRKRQATVSSNKWIFCLLSEVIGKRSAY